MTFGWKGLGICAGAGRRAGDGFPRLPEEENWLQLANSASRCIDAVMRTTVTIDDDVLAVARALADRDGTSLGTALSELARRGFKGAPTEDDADMAPSLPLILTPTPSPARMSIGP